MGDHLHREGSVVWISAWDFGWMGVNRDGERGSLEDTSRK